MSEKKMRQRAVEPLPRSLKLLMLVIVLGAFLVQLDSTMLSIALNSLRTSFDASITTIQWVTTGYLLSLTMAVPLVGWATDRFGARRMWITAIGIFGAASLACSLAWSAEALIVFRVVQGIGGGLLLPLAQAILARAAGPARLGRAMSAIGIPSVLGVVLGPVLGGVLVTNLDWHWVFYINIPVAIAAIVFSMRLMPADEPVAAVRDRTRLDVLGLVLLSPGLAAAIYGLSQVSAYNGFSDPHVWGWLGSGLVLIAAFVLRTLRTRIPPLIDLKLLAGKGFAGGASALFFMGLVMYGVSLVLPLYFQEARGWTALHAGLLNIPFGFGTALALAVSGRLADKLGPRKVAFGGGVLGVLGILVFTQLTDTTSQVILCTGGFLAAMGLTALNVGAMTAAFRDVPKPMLPGASSTLRILQQFGGSFGAAVLAVVLQNQMIGAAASGPLTQASMSAAYGNTFWWAAAFLAIAALPTLLLPSSPATESSEDVQMAAAVGDEAPVPPEVR